MLSSTNSNMTWQSCEVSAINHGRQPTALPNGVEISQVESQMVIGLEILAAVLMSIEKK